MPAGLFLPAASTMFDGVEAGRNRLRLGMPDTTAARPVALVDMLEHDPVPLAGGGDTADGPQTPTIGQAAVAQAALANISGEIISRNERTFQKRENA